MALRWTGNGRGTVVLLHGMMSLAGTWWKVGPALAERGWEVTAIDLAAHGGHRLAGPLTAEALVESVVSQVSGPVDLLVGHSMGAATAATVLVEHPSLARAAVLEDPPGGLAARGGELAHGIELDTGTARTERGRLVRRSRAEHPGWAENDVEYDVIGIEQADGAAVAAGLRGGPGGGLGDWDLPALIGAARVPVLVLAATEDSALAGDMRAGVRAAVPADRFVELPGGHCLHRDLPDRWLAEVDAFTAAVL